MDLVLPHLYLSRHVCFSRTTLPGWLHRTMMRRITSPRYESWTFNGARSFPRCINCSLSGESQEDLKSSACPPAGSCQPRSRLFVDVIGVGRAAAPAFGAA